MIADLHIHSLCSDGALFPAELARRAKKNGVQLFSLTDHDTLAGEGEAAEAARALGLRFVRGIEISAYLGATKVHVLGYGCAEGKAYEKFLSDRVTGAKARAEDIVAKANAHFGFHVTLDDVEAYHVRKETPLHTMQIVRTFAELLHCGVDELYRDAFGPSKPAFSDLFRPTPQDAVRIVHDMGGLAVLAHPAQILVLPQEVSENFHLYTEEEKDRAKYFYAGARNALMETLAEGGLDGIECRHSTHTAEETEEFLGFAKAHTLFATGGSDFHAEGSGREIGRPAFDAKDVEERLLSLDGSV